MRHARNDTEQAEDDRRDYERLRRGQQLPGELLTHVFVLADAADDQTGGGGDDERRHLCDQAIADR